MVYNIIKFLLTISFRVCFKQVRQINRHQVPAKKPLFVASNHVNAFIDPLVIGKYFPFMFWFVARGDAFKKKAAAWWLNQMHVLPIHRKEDDSDSVIKNSGAMRTIVDKLKKGNRIIIYPEGICIQERRQRRLRKGMARMAFTAEAEADFKLDAYIICAGLNYNRPNQFRADVDVVYGKAFPIKEYETLYKSDPVKANLALTKRMQEEMAALMIIVKNPVNDALFDQVDALLTDTLLHERKITRKQLAETFALRQQLANLINTLQETNVEAINSLRENAGKYFQLLKQNKLRSWVVEQHDRFGMPEKLSGFLVLIIGFPLFIFGLFHHYVAYKLAYRIACKAAKNVEFFSSVNYNAGMFLVIFSYALFFSLAPLFLSGWSLLIYMLGVPLSGIVALYYHLFLKKFGGRLRYARMARSKQGQVLRAMHTDVIKEMRSKLSI